MKIQCQKNVTKIQWDLRLLGAYDASFGSLIIRQRCSAYWAHLWLQSFGALGCCSCSHILHCVLASQKHLGRIVAARKFEVFRVVDVLCGVWRNCIQTALVAADRLDLFSKCGQKVSTCSLTMYWRRVQLQSQNCFWKFQRLSRSCMNGQCMWAKPWEFVENPSFEKHYSHFILIWGCEFYTFGSIQYFAFQDWIKNTDFPLDGGTSFVPKHFQPITYHIAIAAANLLSTSRWLFALSESSVPKYIASCFRGTGANRWVPHVVLSGRRHLGTCFPARGPRYTLAT